MKEPTRPRQPPPPHHRPPSTSYFTVSRAPIYSLILVAPFVLVYEIGGLVLDLTLEDFHLKNGAEVLIRKFLWDVLGISAVFVGVLVLALSFVAWQVRSRSSMRFDVRTVGWMFAESAGLALALYILPWQIYRYLAGWTGLSVARAQIAGTGGIKSFFVDMVMSCGAGVYEEFLFRVLLVTLIALICKRLFKMESVRAGIVAVGLGAVLFSLAHYVPPHGDPIFAGGEFHPTFWIGFLFRTLAGVYFAALYYFRCFGVAVGTHALYDILVSIDHALIGR